MGLSKIAAVIVVGLLLSINDCNKSQQPQNLTCPAGTWCSIGSTGMSFAYMPHFQDSTCGPSDCPEIGVVRMPNTLYQQFSTACQSGNGVTWLNTNAKIFTNNLNRVLTPCPPGPGAGGGSPYTYVTVLHWPNSTAASAGYPQTSP